MLFTGTLMLFRNTSQSTVVLLSFLILIKYNCLAWPWKNWRFHPSQLLLPEMERTRRKSSKKQDLTSINQRRKTEVLYSVRCLYPAASSFDEFTRRIYTELGLKVLFLKHPLHSSQTLSAVPTWALFITRGRRKEGKNLPLSKSGFMTHGLLKQAAVRNAVRFISISSHGDRCWPSLHPFKDIRNNGHYSRVGI